MGRFIHDEPMSHLLPTWKHFLTCAQSLQVALRTVLLLGAAGAGLSQEGWLPNPQGFSTHFPPLCSDTVPAPTKQLGQGHTSQPWLSPHPGSPGNLLTCPQDTPQCSLAQSLGYKSCLGPEERRVVESMECCLSFLALLDHMGTATLPP